MQSRGKLALQWFRHTLINNHERAFWLIGWMTEIKMWQKIHYCQQTEISQSIRSMIRTVCLFFMNLFGSRQGLETVLMKFSILRQSRGKTERKAPEFHSRGNERPTERGNVPSVNRSTLQSSSLLFRPISYKQHILLPRVGWWCTDKLFKLNLKSLFPKCYTAHPL